MNRLTKPKAQMLFGIARNPFAAGGTPAERAWFIGVAFVAKLAPTLWQIQDDGSCLSAAQVSAQSQERIESSDRWLERMAPLLDLSGPRKQTPSSPTHGRFPSHALQHHGALA